MRDAVDMFLDQWARERPGLDVSPMGPIGRLSRASHLVGKRLKENFAREDMEAWEFDVLATLVRSGPPHTLTPKELSAMTMVGSAAMTNRVDRLVAKGMVGREVDPDNRRRLLISLTPEGEAWVDRVLEGHLATERRLLAGLSEEDRAGLDRLLRALLCSLGDSQDDLGPATATGDRGGRGNRPV
ncbi:MULTISPECIES: MarR family winged helix-turn-helix transcriptional regulator [Nocardiopsis]|uniref:MarR family transcriptional regulator n=1 Tax=Nocardiopsis lambiniae TaxID=3075539 RepID=A0ABU2MEI2_9ACTN|nr:MULTISPECIES: MarR family transcriptional regulator [unclassified Nocardiopsis]MDE3724487.1 MarR family transcriptional regulator [Nocardiopsis sp. N85]MDT0330969.1 MarR family transcriptional regulator [Nocardiopsis sp. DSM 44743]